MTTPQPVTSEPKRLSVSKAIAVGQICVNGGVFLLIGVTVLICHAFDFFEFTRIYIYRRCVGMALVVAQCAALATMGFRAWSGCQAASQGSSPYGITLAEGLDF